MTVPGWVRRFRWLMTAVVVGAGVLAVVFWWPAPAQQGLPPTRVGQQVANELGVSVLAPTDRVGIISALGPGQTPIIDNGGSWLRLHPEG